MKIIFRLFLLSLLYSTTTTNTFAYSLKQIVGKDKLSSSSITAICQDDNGIMWLGTNNGLNSYNGREVAPYIPSSDAGIISGNVIGPIIYTGNNICWIQTYHGLNKYNTGTGKLLIYPEFNKRYYIEKDNNNNLFVIKENNTLYYFHNQSNSFKKTSLPNIICDQIINFFFDNNNKLWVVTSKGFYFRFNMLENKKTGIISVIPDNTDFTFKDHLQSCFYNDKSMISINSNYDLFHYNLLTGKDKLIINLKKEIQSRGRINTVLEYKGRFFVGFEIGGVIIIEKKVGCEDYFFTELGINCGIYLIKKDRFQDILWIGTYGQALYEYSETAYSIKSTVLNNETFKMWHPVRSIFIDKEKTLWIATKGDGILKVFNYDENKKIENCKYEKQTISNTLLNSNAVYRFAESKRNVLWIGNEEGLNYFSYKERKIKSLKVVVEGLPFKFIHDIYEDKNSDLWMTSVNMGIVKAHIGGSGNCPILENIKHYTICNGTPSSNYFFSIFQENDSIFWFSNKGHGPYKFNTHTETLNSLSIKYSVNNKTINDVFSIIKDKSNNLFFGTGFGLVQFQPSGKYTLYNTLNGILNRAVRVILQGKEEGVWISTNKGIVLFNAAKNVFRVFEGEYGQDVVEFSDGAAFKDKNTGTLYFGGNNGFVSIVERDIPDQKYTPSVSFDKLSLFGENTNLFDYISGEGNNKTLKLHHNQNFFGIEFNAVDYLNERNYTYYYKLSGLSDKWINNGRSNIAAFTSISPGNYILNVKYFNHTDGGESPVYSLKIHIDYPWYRTIWAFCLYFIVIVCIGVLIIRYVLNELTMKRQKIVFESKLDFFTNTTHEFCAPLTLISGPCEQILTQKEISPFVAKNARMIKANADRLNGLIQELIEFRKIETGNRPLQIENLPVSSIMSGILATYTMMAETKKVRFETILPESINWNSDRSLLSSIVINLLSNAFKYTSDEKNIGFELAINNNHLIIKVSNEGVINEKDLHTIFDRYTILENFEKQFNKQNFSRTGLGLAIASNMIKLLKGSIHVENTPENTVMFTILLPQIAITDNRLLNKNGQGYIPSIDIPMTMSHEDTFDKLKSTILIIDDDIEMLWFISEIFSGQFNTIWLQDSTLADQKLQEFYPDLIISDVMMPGLDGISLLKKIKGKKETSNIPIILVSAKHEIEQQIESLSAGAEMYITKPFNVEFFKISVNQLFARKKQFKNYLDSPISSFDLTEGKLTHKEHKKFLMSVVAIINDNIKDPDLSTKFIAGKLGIGSRTLSRKLEEMNEQNAATLIRESRLFVAKNLLVQTTLTIDEIVYKSGFTNKGTFFRTFIQKFDCTPKEYRMKKIEEVKK